MNVNYMAYDNGIHKIVFYGRIKNKEMQIEGLKKKIADFQKQDHEKEQVGQKIFDYQCQQLTECCCDYMRRFTR